MRRVAWPLIVFLFLWLNVVLPGHTRGMITVPGSSPTAQAETPDACCSVGGKKTPDPAKAPTEAPTQDEKRRCAVCFFAAALDLPPVVTFDHSPRGLLAVLPLAEHEHVESLLVLRPYHGRAPPSL